MQPALMFLAAADGGAPISGPYISLVKIVPVLILVLLWGRFLTWVDKDTDRAHLPREGLNIGFTAGLILAFALFLLMPNFAIALPVMIVVLGAEIGAYMAMRNAKVGLQDMKDDFRAWIGGFTGKKQVKVVAGAVTFFDPAAGALAVPPAESPDRPAYDALQTLFTDPLQKNAERIDVTPGEGASQVRYSVDGVSYNAPSMDRAASSAAINFLKPLAKLNVEEKRKPQTGAMKVQLEGKKKDLEVSTAGSSAGEFLKVLVEPKKRHLFKIDKLGFAPEQFGALEDSIHNQRGIVLVAAPRGQGLTSMLYALVRAHDAFVQHIQTLERAPETEIEGVTVNKLAANAPAAEEAKQVAWIISQEPDVLMVSQVDDASTPRQLIDFASSERQPRIYIGMRANSTFDALAMWRKMVGDDALAMKQLNMVIAGRVMRKLCMACKVAYAPDPEQLKKLNLNPANASKLFQARREPLRDPKGNPIPCEFCKELRYNGRFGVYEVLVIDDDIRAVVGAGGSVNQIKAAFRKQRGRLLQEVALSTVEAGDTSLAEVKRVMEAGAPAAGGGDGGGAPVSGGRGGGGGGGGVAAARPSSRAPARPASQ